MTKVKKNTAAEKESSRDEQNKSSVKECADLVSFYLKRYLDEREKERSVKEPS